MSSPRGVARNAVVLMALTALATAAGCTAGTPTGPDGTDGTAADDVPPFDAAAGTTLFEPADPASVGADAPLVVLVPGGGWSSADPAGLEPLARWLADRGAVVATITYRTSSDGAYFPLPAQDVLCATARAAALAAEADLTTGEVVLVGHSAGAHLAALAALAPDDLDADCADPAVTPDRLVGLAGPYDVDLLGGVADQVFGPAPADRAAGNPLTLADRRPELPVLLLHGTADDVVPVDFTQAFAEALRAGGHDVTDEYPQGEDHGTVYQPDVAGPPIADWLGLPG